MGSRERVRRSNIHISCYHTLEDQVISASLLLSSVLGFGILPMVPDLWGQVNESLFPYPYKQGDAVSFR